MKILQVMVVAGEASGDMHGAALVHEMLKKNPGLVFFGIGGDRMRAEGVELVRHAKEMAFLGFFEVLKHYPFIRKVFRQMNGLLDSRKPGLVILIDYPGFNLRFAREVKKRGIPVFYYISPQVWAWGKGRVKKMAEWIDRIAVIFPFEEAIYRRAGVRVQYVGHPLKDSVKSAQSRKDFLTDLGFNPDHPVLGLLPGSRKQEIKKLLPEMIRACQIIRREIPDLQAAVGMSPTLSRFDYEPFVTDFKSIRLVEGKTYEVMGHSDAVLVASGTATLETALLGTPMVILYKMAPLSYLLGRMLVRVEHIGLVNIVAGRRIVPELIQRDANAGKIAAEVLPFLLDKEKNQAVRRELKTVSKRLGKGGASARTAEWVLDMMKTT